MNHFFTGISKGLVILAAWAGCASLSGCIQSKSIAASVFENKEPVIISEQTIKLVNQAFYSDFNGGDWYYQGAKEVRGTIDAYIQIPSKLDMSKAAQQNYLMKSICPSANEEVLWQALKGVPLSVHIYTFSKKHTVYATCDNPLT